MVTAWQANLISMVGEGGVLSGGGWYWQPGLWPGPGSESAAGTAELGPLPTERTKAGSGSVPAWATSLKRSMSMERSIRRMSSGEVVRGAWAVTSKRSRSSQAGPPRTLLLSTL